MRLIIVLFLLVNALSTGRPTTHTPPPYCYFNEGCAVASFCECPSTFTYCNIKDNYDGVCEFTNAGIGLLFVICIASLGVLILCLCCICCCCGRKAPDTYHVVNYHPAQTTSPLSYDGHSYL